MDARYAVLVVIEQVAAAVGEKTTGVTGVGIMARSQEGGDRIESAGACEIQHHVLGRVLTLRGNGDGFVVIELDGGDIVGQILVGLANIRLGICRIGRFIRARGRASGQEGQESQRKSQNA